MRMRTRKNIRKHIFGLCVLSFLGEDSVYFSNFLIRDQIKYIIVSSKYFQRYIANDRFFVTDDSKYSTEKKKIHKESA